MKSIAHLGSGRGLILALLAVHFTQLGCASHSASKRNPREGIAEFRELTVASQNAVHTALRSLERVSAQTNSCPPDIGEEFARVVEQLQADSVRVRARAQAMLARGDAYFEEWQEHLAQVKDPRMRQLAQQNRPSLERSFGRIKLAAQTAGEAFRPCLADLRRLEVRLEADPRAPGSAAAHDLIQSVRHNGQEVLRQLQLIEQELNAMDQTLTPPKN